MAGGEGTRLRPLTSNAPKPMLPLVNRPMMEHVVELLKRHGIDEIVVTVAFMANAIRTYFGDGSEFGVRMAYATEESPLGTAGSVRNAMDELDERFLVISGDVLTDIDLGRHRRVPRRAPGHGHHRPGRTSRTRSSSASSSPARTAASSASWRSRRGARCSATPSTPASSCSSPRSSTTSPRIGRSTSRARCSPSCWTSDMPLYGAIAEGYWEDVGTLEAYVRAHKDILDGKVQVNIPGFELSQGVWLGEGAEINPEAVLDRPGGDRRQLPGRGRGPHRPVHGARRQRARAPRRPARAGRGQRQRLPGRGRAAARRGGRAGPATCARACGPTRAWSSATSASSARRPISAPR